MTHPFFLSLALLLLSFPASAFSGKVVGVSDGDTITVMHQGKGERVRLYGIDCPEKGQAFGQKAKRFTSDMVFGKIVEVEPMATDRYGRTVGFVFAGRECLNVELIRSGFAWVYVEYCSDKYKQPWGLLEAQARESRSGLWADRSPVAPWAWRREQRRGGAAPMTTPPKILKSYTSMISGFQVATSTPPASSSS